MIESMFVTGQLVIKLDRSVKALLVMVFPISKIDAVNLADEMAYKSIESNQLVERGEGSLYVPGSDTGVESFCWRSD
jgi:hypothetical protein